MVAVAAAPDDDDLVPPPRGAIVYPPFDELIKVIFGEPSSGKTSFCAACPDSFIIATEPGQDFVAGAPAKRVFSWAPGPNGYDKARPDFQSMVRRIYERVEAGTFPYRSVTVDIVDNLYGYCLSEVCARKGIDYPPENDFGRTWKEVREEWERWIRSLLDIVAVNFITHAATEKVEIEGKRAAGAKKGTTKEIERRMPTFRGNKAAQFLDGIISLTGFAHKGLGGEYLITFSPTPILGTKDRTGVFADAGPIPLVWDTVAEYYRAAAEAKGIAIESKWAAAPL